MKPEAITLLVGLGLLGGCNAGPNYSRPSLPVAAIYSGLSPSGSGRPAGEALPRADLAHWWEALGDPELNSLLDRAAVGNLDLAAAVDRLQQSRAILSQFVGASLPEINGSGVSGSGTGNNFGRGGSIDGPLAQAINTSGLKTVSQVLGVDSSFEVDVFGSVRREVQAVAADAAAANEFRNQVLVTLLGDAARTYVGVRTLQLRVSIAEQAIQAQRRASELARQRFQRGITNELDSALADRELETTEATLAPLRAQLLATKRNLAVVLGLEPDALFAELEAPAPLPRPPSELDPGLPVDLLRRRPDVRQAEAQLIAANARLGIATAKLYPRIFMTGAIGLETQGQSTDPQVYRGLWEAAPAFSWPLLDFGAVDAAIQAQDQATRAQVASFRKVVLAAVAQVDNNLTGFQAESQRLTSLGRAVVDAQRALDLATQRYNRGIIDYLNVLDAQRTLFALQDQQAISEQLDVADFVNVCQSLGGGWEGFPPPPRLHRPLPALLAAIRDASGNSDRPLSH